MSDNTHIEWASATWSPVTGCTRVSPGCINCYIERTPPFRMAHRRFDKDGIGGSTGVQLHPERLAIPLHWRKPRRIFVCSLADLFHDDVPDEYIAHVFAAMQSCAAHTFQVLTKRPHRMRSLLTSEAFWSAVADFGEIVMAQKPSRAQLWPDHGQKHGYLPNVWVGTSVESGQWAWRADVLRGTPAVVRFLSCEPLLGPLPDLDLTGIGWVIAGGESGPGARPMHPQWARGLRDQCTAAGVPFFLKQWGEWAPERGLNHSEGNGRRLHYARTFLRSDGSCAVLGDGGGPGECLERVGKKRAGRLLDGREWSEFPQAVTHA